ncbi:run domain Beclin-1-interacting and cysteine-rich domain-containing protein-like [Saccoglossus kowalevskii]|uniref:Run domain Beclin-1 interacting and cysteine-rich containing protein-like n=1 Tax=Saccoglossus kowalevskii TaxID=10224 RepID=A0ABM0M8X2_SACKO|nr:PREDICTED: run domain Beclin-1 interacting and cysteine-rich containing protein-like [Saccoglossus kowalevskii]
MATKGESDDLRLQHQQLLLSLKSTVEGLLASHSSNVWSTYGGLSRLCSDVENILRHGVRQQQGLFTTGSQYWTFIKGLRWLNPVSAPLIEHTAKRSSDDVVDRGKAWVKQSLQDHNLSAQLKILVENEDHLRQCYFDGAFLCSRSHYHAMHICLKSVEENNPALLADLDPKLLKLRKISHTRSSSLPINPILGHSTTNMANSKDTTPISMPTKAVLHPPQFASPKTETILTTSDEHATATNVPSSPAERLERRNSAKNILLSVLENTDYRIGINSDYAFPKIASDPLMNTQFHLDSSYAKNMDNNTTQKNHLKNSNKSNGAKNSTQRKTTSLPKNTQENIKEKRFRKERKTSSVNEDEELCHVTEEEEGDEGIEFPRKPLNINRTLSNNNKELFANDSDDELREEDILKKRTAKKESDNSRTSRLFSQHTRSKSDLGVLCQIQGTERYTDKTEVDGANLSSSLPSKIEQSQPFLDRGYVSPTECMFPKPVEGQSLMSFLSSQDFQTWPDLDRENAHFSISEAIIAAIEQIKCNQPRKSAEDQSDASSDEEIQELQQRIRIRRRERLKQKAVMISAFSDGRTDTTTETTSSASPFSSPAGSGSENSDDSGSSDQVEQLDLADNTNSTNLTELSNLGLTSSLASLYSDADIQKNLPQNESSSNNHHDNTTKGSADAVAICLLKKFSAKLLPAASDLDWLVSEQDVPQALLPLPKSFPISPDDGENSDLAFPNKNIRVRGNLEWAPPRAQIIFNIHPAPRRKVIIAKQNYRCAGCGMKIEPGYMKRLRYCEYLGKYFCHCCHANGMTVIPGRILRKWDFHKYPVSNFARDLITKMQNDPFFNVTDINPSLYRRVRSLEAVREYRTQLYYLKDFLRTCRQGQSMWNEFDKRPHHLIHDVNIYSIIDLLKVRSGEMPLELRELVEDAITHVTQCQLCQAKGFICELCNNNEIIYPFELHKCIQCAACWACYHSNCYLPDKCPKCERIRVRRSKRQSKNSDSDEE